MAGQIFAPAISALPPSVVVVLGQFICPWMDGSRAMQEQLPRSSCRGAIADTAMDGR